MFEDADGTVCFKEVLAFCPNLMKSSLMMFVDAEAYAGPEFFCQTETLMSLPNLFKIYIVKHYINWHKCKKKLGI